MKLVLAGGLAIAISASVAAQRSEEKPVPKDSERVSVAGCTTGQVFTVGLPAADQGGSPLPVNTRLRMAGPRTLIDEIKAREGGRIELTGLMKKGQFAPGGVRLGGGRVTIGPGTGSPGGPGGTFSQQPVIDVEGWRRVPGECPR